jgi:hypothetical protein
MTSLSVLWLSVVILLRTSNSQLNEICVNPEDSCLNSKGLIESHLNILYNSGKYRETCNKFATNYKPSNFKENLIFLPHVSGISDRFVGMTTVFVLSLATGRKFQLGNMPELNGFEQTFDFPYPDMARRVTKPAIISKLREKGMNSLPSRLYYRPPNSILVNAISDDSLLLSETFVSQAFNYSNIDIFISTNRGLTIRAFDVSKYTNTLAGLGLTRETAFGCAFNHMFKPKPHIFAPLVSILSKMADPNRLGLRIAIHIRSGDNVLNNNKSIELDWFKTYFECAMELEEDMLLTEEDNEDKKVTWFLFSDSISLRQQAVARYGDKVVTALDVPVEHSAKEMVCPLRNCVSDEGFSTAVAEWWLLGHADYIVASLYSGFGKSAAMRGFKQDSLYFTHRGDTKGCLNTRKYASTQGLGTILAGI